MTLRFIRNGKRYDLGLLLLVIPFVVYVLIFSYLPLWGWLYSVFKFVPGRPVWRSEFVGLYYYRAMFGGFDFPRIMLNTVAMSVLQLLATPLPVVFAILLSEVRIAWFRRSVQTVSTFPHFVSWVIVFSLSFSMIGNDGMLNLWLERAGLQPIRLLSNRDATWYFQTALGVWKSLGWGSIVYLAAITAIDQELYEAVAMDGGGAYRRIVHVTLPGVLPAYFVLLLLSISGLISSDLEKIFVYQNPLVIDRLETIDLYTYRLGIVYQQYSFSLTVGIFKSVVSVILLFTANHLSKFAQGHKIF